MEPLHFACINYTTVAVFIYGIYRMRFLYIITWWWPMENMDLNARKISANERKLLNQHTSYR